MNKYLVFNIIGAESTFITCSLKYAFRARAHNYAKVETR